MGGGVGWDLFFFLAVDGEGRGVPGGRGEGAQAFVVGMTGELWQAGLGGNERGAGTLIASEQRHARYRRLDQKGKNPIGAPSSGRKVGWGGVGRGANGVEGS